MPFNRFPYDLIKVVLRKFWYDKSVLLNPRKYCYCTENIPTRSALEGAPAQLIGANLKKEN